mmetsp:Transcript_67021/g.119027  ORF Transcript_67021/g.119027 Transcript_67021/m.119027 type:complete len:95 (-) Transcript_67021:2070-2354(-)
MQSPIFVDPLNLDDPCSPLGSNSSGLSRARRTAVSSQSLTEEVASDFKPRNIPKTEDEVESLYRILQTNCLFHHLAPAELHAIRFVVVLHVLKL